MLLEIPSQIGLAGKVQVIRYLLHGHFRGTQQHLCLQYDMPVYNGLRRLARHLPGDSGEITGRDTKLVRIELSLIHGCTHFAGGSRRSTLSYHTY